MKLFQIINPNFTEALKALIDTKLPAVTAYKLKSVTAIVEAEQNKFEEVRRKLVEQYAEKNEGGSIKKDKDGNYKVDPEQLPNFLKEIEALIQEEVVLPSIKLADLGEKAELTVRQVVSLDGLLVE
jgi:hypothetical protein